MRFPYYFQLLPSDINLAHVFYSIIREYGWRRVALIVQNEYKYRAVGFLAIFCTCLPFSNLCVTMQTMDVLKHLFSNSNTSIEVSETTFDLQSETSIVEMKEVVFVSYTDSIIYVILTLILDTSPGFRFQNFCFCHGFCACKKTHLPSMMYRICIIIFGIT